MHLLEAEPLTEEAPRLDYIQFIVIDLFCGAGGTTIGFEKAKSGYDEMYAFLKSVGIDPPKDKETFFKVAKVVACVNHDHLAIKSHWSNHPDVEHFEEDIRILDPYGRLRRLIEIYRALYPHAKIILWASLECTNFSKAKGGEARDEDSRTLALELYHYIHALDPDYIFIENVVEFMSWGPMIVKLGKTSEGYSFCPLKKQKRQKVSKKVKVEVPLKFLPSLIPESRNNGKDWMRWRESVRSFGYEDEWKQINAADLGALTSRNRLFGCFAKTGLPIVWPLPTHSKKKNSTSIEKPLKDWQPVKKALDFDDEGQTIFNRYKRIPKVLLTKEKYEYVKLNKYNKEHKTFGPIPHPLSPKTFQRLFMGCIRHIAGGKENFMTQSSNGWSKIYTTDNPSRVITTKDNQHLVKANFLSKAFSGNPDDKNISTEDPSGAITTKDHHQLIQAFITKWNSNNKDTGGNSGHSIDEPAPVVTTQNRLGLAQVDFLVNYNHSSNSNSIDETGPAITAADKLGKAQINFISTYNGVNGGKHDNSHSVEGPIGALTTGDTKSKITAKFIDQRNGTNPENRSSSVDDPAKTLTSTGGNQQIVSANFIDQQYSQGKQNSSIDEPLGAVTTVPKANLIFIDKQFSGEDNHQSIEQPAGAILPNDKHNIVQAEKFILNTNYNNNASSIEQPAPTLTASRRHHYIVNPSWYGNSGSVEEPCFVVVARQDKAPLYLITCKEGPVAVPVYEGDCEWTIKIKEFMALYGICDIKMRMLKVIELKKIQGFPEDYILLGNQTDQKKYIGNAVHPYVSEHWIMAFHRKFTYYYREAA